MLYAEGQETSNWHLSKRHGNWGYNEHLSKRAWSKMKYYTTGKTSWRMTKGLNRPYPSSYPSEYGTTKLCTCCRAQWEAQLATKSSKQASEPTVRIRPRFRHFAVRVIKPLQPHLYIGRLKRKTVNYAKNQEQIFSSRRRYQKSSFLNKHTFEKKEIFDFVKKKSLLLEYITSQVRAGLELPFYSLTTLTITFENIFF